MSNFQIFGNIIENKWAGSHPDSTVRIAGFAGVWPSVEFRNVSPVQ